MRGMDNCGDGKSVDSWLYEEGERIIKTYGNHPSFTFLLHGNEPGEKIISNIFQNGRSF
jgi:hypothetical protein